MLESAEGVAVLIAAKDASATIGFAVASALAQAGVEEVIVVDDGSTDDTAEAARRSAAGDPRLKVERFARNLGPSAARNRGIALTRAPIVCVLDADDTFLPGRIQGLLSAAGGEWDFVADGIVMQKEGAPGGSMQRNDFNAILGQQRLSAAEFIEGNISRPGRLRRELGFMKPLMRREFLERHRLRYDERLRLGEDYVLYAEALVRGAVFRLAPGCGYAATWREESLSGRHSAADLMALAAADARMLAQAGLPPDVRAALKRHAASIRQKADYRTALDLKRGGDYRGLFHLLIVRLFSIPFMCRETMRARFG